MRKFVGAICAATAFMAAPAWGQTDPTVEVENAQTADTQWYRDAGFGLFIHWGLYTQAGGEWQGKRYFGIVEHLMRQAKADPSEYIRTLGSQFNPVDFNAAEWVAVAKQAGARYIIITTKHHDGFAMFGSAVSRDDIIDATPFHRDVIKELARECARAGIRLGFYYSHVQDWSDPDGWNDFTKRPGHVADFNRYMERKALPQVRELMRNYGKVGVVWYDTPKDITRSQAQRFRDAVKLENPATLVSSRIGQNLGDIRNYGDSEMPDFGDSAMPWEAIYTHNDSWGFSKFDHNFKTSAELIRTLATAASRGGNMVLNVGPDPRGNFPHETKDALVAIGAWLRANGESIYGTQASVIRQPWGVGTARPGTLYLHVFHRPAGRKLLVPGLAASDIRRVTSLESGAQIAWRVAGDDIVVELPQDLPPSPDLVLKVEHHAALPQKLAPAILSADYDGLTLIPGTATPSGDIKPLRIAAKSYYGVSHPFMSVEGMRSQADLLAWEVQVPDAGEFTFDLEYSATPEQAGQQGAVTIGNETRYFQVIETGRLDPNKVTPLYRQPIGSFRFGKPGTYRIVVRPEQTHGELFTLKSVILKPAEQR